MAQHGQTLFVRPLVPADLIDLRALTGSSGMACPESGLMARLVGEPAGFVAFTSLKPDLRIDEIFVAAPWRGKRIGRGLIYEVEKEARRLDCTGLVVDRICGVRDFFLHLGFEDSGAILVKVLGTF